MVVAELAPSAVRRTLAVAMLALTGCTLVYVGSGGELSSTAERLATLALGAGTLFLSWKVWIATSLGLVLTPDAVLDSAGRMIVRIDDIVALDRGILALRPTNGLVLAVRNKGPVAWQPGLWWRFGHRVGIGGVLARSDTKRFSDCLAASLENRLSR